ncbi:MAG: hypothetical protein M3498_02580 [Deinococcota bacterium]|nr:hypothetical protein [Deinococcota bacterium]
MPDLLTILIIIFFVIGPIINSLLRRSQGQQPPTRPQPRQQPPTAPTTGPEASVPAPELEARGAPKSDFERRLEEARRRVQEAMTPEGRAPEGRAPEGRVPEGRGRGQAGLPDKQETAAPRQGGERRPREARRVPTEARPARQARPQAPEVEVAVTLRDARTTARPQPAPYSRKDGRRAAYRGAWAIHLDPDSLREAIVWREILDKPLSKRRRQHP